MSSSISHLSCTYTFSHAFIHSHMDIAKINFHFGKMFLYKVFAIVIPQVLVTLSCINTLTKNTFPRKKHLQRSIFYVS